MTGSSREMALETFLAAQGWGAAARGMIAGDASFRRYWRLRRGDETAVLMDAPPPDEDVGPFIAIDRHLRSQGFSAPAIYAQDATAGFLLLEDLGDDLYTPMLARGADEAELYGAAVDLLVELHRLPVPGGITAYDTAEMIAKAELLLDWYLPALTGEPVADRTRRDYTAIWQDLLRGADTLPPVLALRDYHADNLIWLPGRQGTARVGLLDFQDAMAASPAYDLVSLLADIRRDVPADLAAIMIDRYVAASACDEAKFRHAYDVMGAQRNSRIIGTFVRLWQRDGKPGYPAYLPKLWEVLEPLLTRPGLEALRDWMDHEVPMVLRREPLPGWQGE